MPFSPSEGYDIAAKHYDDWHWQEFWHRNEWPLIEKELTGLSDVHSILDIGCGTGRCIERLSANGYMCRGIDLSSRMIERAKERLGDKIEIIQASIESLPYKDSEFDCAIACRVLSHLNDLKRSFKELQRIVRDEGYLLITDLHTDHQYKKGHTRVSGDWGEVVIDTYTHSPQSIIDIAHTFGWGLISKAILSSKSISWFPVNDPRFSSLDATDDRSISYILLFQKR